MADKFYGLLFGILSFTIGIIFTFFHKKIIQLQGESKKGDWTIEQRRRKMIIAGIIFLIGGISLIVRYS